MADKVITTVGNLEHPMADCGPVERFYIRCACGTVSEGNTPDEADRAHKRHQDDAPRRERSNQNSK